MNSASSSSEMPPLPPSRPGWWGLLLVLVFGLLAWGVWWYFDYKIRSLDAAWPP